MTIYQELAHRLTQNREKIGRPIIQGILGGQGTGKTTLAKALILILEEMGCRAATLSLDDLYKTYCDRMALQQVDPRFIWRGPPGTHDIDLGLTVLDAIRTSQNPVIIPRFDKSLHSGMGDRTTPEIVSNIDILLFEGWFVGVRPLEPSIFNTAPPPIISVEHKTFARDVNQLLSDYIPLWERLDSLIVLYPQDYRYSIQWRKQAEHDAIATGKAGMTDNQIEEFVNYFWRTLHPELFIEPLITSPELVDLVIEINADHTLGRAYQA